MSEIEKMQRYINNTKIHSKIIILAFNYGRAKGYRAAQAKMKLPRNTGGEN